MSGRDTDFMSELDAARRIGPARSVMMMFFAIIALVVFGMIWASISQIEQLTRAQGRVVPSQEIKYIQSLEGGVLEELLVREGQVVKKGDVLLRISDVQFSSEARGTEAKFLELIAKKARLEAEASGEEFVVPDEIKDKAPQIAANELALYNSRQQELKNAYKILDDRIAKARADMSEVQAQINRLVASRKSLEEELAITREMVAKRAVPKLEQLRLEREVSDARGQINAQSQRKRALEAEVQVAKTERASQDDTFRSQALSEMNKVETELSTLRGSMETSQDRVDRAELRSPVDGVVNKIALSTIGGVVEPAMRLMEIVPVDDELKIVAQVSPADIGFIRAGQRAKVKITAYDPQLYGSLDGELVRVGANAMPGQDGAVFFEIEVKTEKSHLDDADGNPLPITAGMVANVEVITGKRTIMGYLLKPIFRARQRVFTER